MLGVAALCAAWSAIAGRGHAYSSFGDYVRPIEEGGGGGRLFTGTPADGHGCDVCHRGAEGAPLQIFGLPVDGYVPGQSYEITFVWPETEPNIALMAELTDLAGRPAGATSLLPYASWQPGELCGDGAVPAADVCRAGGAGDGCCRELDPMRDACSFPGERTAFWVVDCDARFARMLWTAPDGAAGDVWFSAEMVTSDLQNDASGDGVTSALRRLRPAGAPEEVVAAVGDCNAAGAGRLRPAAVASTAFGLVLGLFLRRLRRSDTGSRAPGHEEKRTRA